MVPINIEWIDRRQKGVTRSTTGHISKEMRAMTDQPASSPFAMPDLAMISAGQTQHFAEIQAALLTAMQEINRHWLGHLQSETALATDLASGLSTAHSVPEAAGFWQDWANRRMELATEEARSLYAGAHALASTCMPTPDGTVAREKSA